MKQSESDSSGKTEDDLKDADHWDDKPNPKEEATYWGEERSFQIKHVVELGEAKIPLPWGDLRVKDLKIKDKATLIIISVFGMGLLLLLTL